MKSTYKQQETINEGWSIQIYSGNRRLICSLEPSHGWTFFAGCILGILMTVILFNIDQSSTVKPVSHPTPTVIEPLPID